MVKYNIIDYIMSVHTTIYNEYTADPLSDIRPPSDVINCKDTQCQNIGHYHQLDNMYCQIIDCLKNCSSRVFKNKNKSKYNKPGWSEYVADAYAKSKQALIKWLEAGKPRN